MEKINLRPKYEPKRTENYKIDESFETILSNANQELEKIEKKLIKEIKPPNNPLIIICFAPRSGSTFLSQLLANTKQFHYISNFIARFWDAPYFAGILEKKLGIRNFVFQNNENSNYGVTISPNEPHEFGFFWNKWLPRSEKTDHINIENISEKKINLFRKEIYAIMSLYKKPFFIKNGIVGLNILLMNKLFNNVKYIVLKRNPLYIAQSLYKARIDLYGDEKIYLSTRPSNYYEIKNLSVYQQIALQIKGIYNDIYNDIEKINADFIEIFYENLCKHPKQELQNILRFLDINENINFDFIKNFKPNGNKIYLNNNIIQKLENALLKVFDNKWFQM